jgi:hypothetical protein
MATKKGSSKKSARKKQARGSGPRERLSTKKANFFARRNEEGEFSEMDNLNRSIPADRAVKAKKKVKPGFGDKGDQPKRKSSKKSSGRKR